MTFKDIAEKILKEAEKPLHSDEITRLALEEYGFITEGKTPKLTMYAQLFADINSGGKNSSRFKKTGPSTFGLNAKYVKPIKIKTNDISSIQKGDIAEARVAELIVLYGKKPLSCYKPISDDDGIDLIVKEKGSPKTMCIQVKSNFDIAPGRPFSATIPANSSMALVFCLFDTEEGDISAIWFVPSAAFRKLATKAKIGKKDCLSFVSGLQNKESNKWDGYFIGKKDLANKIIEQMKKL